MFCSARMIPKEWPRYKKHRGPPRGPPQGARAARFARRRQKAAKIVKCLEKPSRNAQKGLKNASAIPDFAPGDTRGGPQCRGNARKRPPKPPIWRGKGLETTQKPGYFAGKAPKHTAALFAMAKSIYIYIYIYIYRQMPGKGLKSARNASGNPVFRSRIPFFLPKNPQIPRAAGNVAISSF